MIEPRPAIRRFATSVVGAAIARGDDAGDVTARLYASLANLVGPAGFDVLLARSLVLARRDHPFLANVGAGPGGALTGLAGAADRVSVEQGTAAIVSYFVELLAVLIGEDLAMRLARDVWPGAPESGAAPPDEEKE
jgi:hypothetical protein